MNWHCIKKSVKTGQVLKILNKNQERKLQLRHDIIEVTF